MNAFIEEREGGARYLQALREHWLVILTVIVATVSTAALYSLTAAKRYQASADILVSPIAPADETFVGIGVLRESTQSRSVLTAARLIETPAVAEAVKERLDLAGGRGQLLSQIEVQPQEQSNIVTIEATAPSPEAAARLANAFADVLLAQRTAAFQEDVRAVIERLEARLAAIPSTQPDSGEAIAIQQRLGELGGLVGANDPTLQISSRAVPPERPSWPRPVLSLAVALIAGLLLGTGMALALEFFNPLFRREDELVVEQRLPILARIPRMRRRAFADFLMGREPLPADVKESYRVLRATVATAGVDGGVPRSILVTSASPGEGKSMTSVNLAVAMAQSGLRVILVDGDLRRPMVSTLMRVPARRDGLLEFAQNGLPADRALSEAPGYGERLQLMLAAPAHSSRVDLLRPDQIRRALQRLEEAADVVILDSPPLSEVADALAMAEGVEAVIVAAFIGRTRRDKLNDVRRMLAQVGANVLGFVVVTKARSRGSAYYYGYPQQQRREARPPSRARSKAPDTVG